jgi:hypothetical protein
MAQLKLFDTGIRVMMVVEDRFWRKAVMQTRSGVSAWKIVWFNRGLAGMERGTLPSARISLLRLGNSLFAQNMFPVNLRRESLDKLLQHNGFLLRNRSRKP